MCRNFQQVLPKSILANLRHIQLEATATSLIEIIIEEFIKLINNLFNGKSPGPAIISKLDLLIDVLMPSVCLKHIFQASVDCS